MATKLRSVRFVALFLVLTCIAHAHSASLPSLSTVVKAAHAHNFDRAISLIMALDDGGPEADSTLLQLLDYYLGAGPSEVLAEAVTKRGDRMLPGLRDIRAKAPSCLKAYIDLCEDKNAADLAARIKFIDRLIAAIEAHKVLRAES